MNCCAPALRTRRSTRRAAPAHALLVASLAAVFAAFAGLAGCGQRGPLVLPDSARPIERLDGLALPDAEPGTSTPAAGEPDLDEDEAENEEPARQ